MISARVRQWLIITLAFAASLGTAALLIARWIRHFVNEDQALLWAAASAWGQLSPHEPNFWGQSYGTTLEAIPAEILRHLGMGYQTGLPLSIAMINLLAWSALALAAWRRGRLLLAVVAVASVAALSPDYVVLAVAYNTAVGRLLNAIAVLIVLWRPHVTWWPACCGISIAGLGVAFDNSTAVLAVPLVIYTAVSLWRAGEGRPNEPRTWLGAAVAVLPAVAFSRFSSWWYHAHPEDLTHPAPTFEPSWTQLRDNLTNPTRHFSVFELEIWQTPWLPLIVVLGVTLWLISRRQWLALTCLGSSAATLGLVLAVPRANEYLETPYYSAGRVMLAAPMALWFAVAVARNSPTEPVTAESEASAGPAAERSPIRTAAPWLLPLAVAVLAVGSLAVRVARWETETVAQRTEAAEFPNYPLTQAGVLHSLCADVSRAVEQEEVSFAVFELRTPAYACAGIGVGAITVYPPYERRSWVLSAFLSTPADTFLYVGATPACVSTLLTCRNVGEQITRIEMASALSPLEALELLDVAVRAPFDRGLDEQHVVPQHAELTQQEGPS